MSHLSISFRGHRIERGLTTARLDHPIGGGNESMIDEGRRLAGANLGHTAAPSAKVARGAAPR